MSDSQINVLAKWIIVSYSLAILVYLNKSPNYNYHGQAAS